MGAPGSASRTEREAVMTTCYINAIGAVDELMEVDGNARAGYSVGEHSEMARAHKRLQGTVAFARLREIRGFINTLRSRLRDEGFAHEAAVATMEREYRREVEECVARMGESGQDDGRAEPDRPSTWRLLPFEPESPGSAALADRNGLCVCGQSLQAPGGGRAQRDEGVTSYYCKYCGDMLARATDAPRG